MERIFIYLDDLPVVTQPKTRDSPLRFVYCVINLYMYMARLNWEFFLYLVFRIVFNYY